MATLIGCLAVFALFTMVEINSQKHWVPLIWLLVYLVSFFMGLTIGMMIYNIQTKLSTEYMLVTHEKHVLAPYWGRCLCDKCKGYSFNPYLTSSKTFISFIYQHAIIYVAIVYEILRAHAYLPIHKITYLQVNILGANNRN